MPLALEFPDGELDTALSLGIPSDRAVRVWLRAPERESVRIVLTSRGRTVSMPAFPDPHHDWLATVDIALDAPHPGESFSVTAQGMTRTGVFAPADGEPSTFAFGFGSCHQPFEPNSNPQLAKHDGAKIYAPALALLRAEEARFLLLVGDQVYSDGVDGQSVRAWARGHRAGDEPGLPELVEAYRHLYRGYLNEAGIRALLDAFPARLTWDDHDIADSWGSRFVETDTERLMFEAASQAYREYQRALEPGSAFVGSPPYHGGFRYGDVAVWSLDLRGIRSWADGRVLGPRQLADTETYLARCADEDVRTVFIVSSIPLIHFSPAIVSVLQWVPGGKGSDVRDRWDAAPFREERDALLGLLGAWQQGAPRRQVIVLSGDVHAGGAFEVYDRPTGGRIQQWTSSSLSAPGGRVHDLVNHLGSRLVNLGESRCAVRRIGVDARNNVATVQVRPATGGGHDVTFNLHAHNGRGRLHRSMSTTSRPR